MCKRENHHWNISPQFSHKLEPKSHLYPQSYSVRVCKIIRTEQLETANWQFLEEKMKI